MILRYTTMSLNACRGYIYLKVFITDEYRRDN